MIVAPEVLASTRVNISEVTATARWLGLAI